MLKPLVAVAALAATSRAILLPPELSEADVAIADALSFGLAETTASQTLELECPGCPVQIMNRHGKIKTKTDKPSHLELTFTVDEQTDGDHLLLNGFELYPDADPFSGALTVPQVLDKTIKHHKRPHHKEALASQLGFSLQVLPTTQTTDDHIYELVTLELQIFEIGTTFVDGIPDVQIRLVKDVQNGKLMIGSLEKAPSTTLSNSEGEECSTAMCRWMAFIKDRLAQFRAFKGCHGAAKHHGAMPGHIKGIPGHHHHNGPRPLDSLGEEPRSYRWVRLFRGIVTHVVLPILVGVLAGVTVSVVGMMIGTLAFAIWRTFFPEKKRNPGYEQHTATQEEVAYAEEKSGLMEHQDPPPFYDEQEQQSTNEKLDV